MARTDAIVLGAGIVGASIALHLVKRGLCGGAGRRGAGRRHVLRQCRHHRRQHGFSASFPGELSTLLRVALKRAPEANYHLSFLPQVAPWLLAFRAWSTPERLVETAQVMRPFFARAVAEHEALMAESGAERYLRRTAG